MTATPAWPPKSAPRLFVDTPLAAGQSRRIDGNAAHYLAQVMRVAPGATIILLDNQTGEWAARVDDAGRRAVDVTVIECLRPRESAPDFWLCVAPIKKHHFDLVIEKATELGVDRIVPVLTRRSVVDKVNAERMGVIMREAAEQCARTALPELAAPITLPRLIADWPAERALLFADEEGGLPAADAMRSAPAPAAILIGPEGGFDAEERALVRGHAAARAISLGPRILRAETAAISATALWMAISGDWQAP
jgi:16S rRNA (uracil1498-N3)-methyltransferase